MSLNDSKEFAGVLQQCSKKYGIPEDILKKLITGLSKNHKVFFSLKVPWRYPETGDSQATCPMLDAMFNIEREKGIIIFIPYREE